MDYSFLLISFKQIAYQLFHSLYIMAKPWSWHIEICFYDGLTFYEYRLSWPQFLFPFYIWFLISLIIVVSHYSLTVAKYLGNFNPVAVLATLLLMSYGKILQASITPLSWGHLTHMYTNTVEHSDCHGIWLYNGNIGFFMDPGHIVLASCICHPYATLSVSTIHFNHVFYSLVIIFRPGHTGSVFSPGSTKSNRSSMLTMPPIGTMVATGLDYSWLQGVACLSFLL